MWYIIYKNAISFKCKDLLLLFSNIHLILNIINMFQLSLPRTTAI